ncbi:MAG: capsule assembly Wzi family protein [Bacteroidota bacterium]|nr:capsule assembly Wzi family protein [Bacteroidota bacterium]
MRSDFDRHAMRTASPRGQRQPGNARLVGQDGPRTRPAVRKAFLRLFFTVALALVIFPAGATSQAVYLPLRHPVYEYLDRIETRYGFAPLQFARPFSRMLIARLLDSLGRSPLALTRYDRDELAFYRREFAEELRRLRPGDTLDVGAPRWNLFRVRSTFPANSFFAADVVLRGGYELRRGADNVIRRSNGVAAYGYADDVLGLSMRWYDNGRSGIPYDVYAARTPEQGIVRGPASSPMSYEYEVAEGQCFYSNSWLTLGIHKMDLWRGSGRRGSLILSDKAPSFPAAGFRIDFSENFSFEYFHAWLMSDSLDDARSYHHLDGPYIKIYATKYLAFHALTARLLPGLQIALGESIVYGGGDINPLFLIPVISFRAADRWTRWTTGNSQFFADARWTPMRGVTLYATGYVDELDFSRVFSGGKDFDYHIAYTAGAFVTDVERRLTGIPSETRVEFTRVYPYVYANPTPTQQYSSHQVVLGHWIGANADLVTLMHSVHPARGWSVRAQLETGRFGDPYPAPLVEGRVQPAFLARPQFGVFQAGGSVEWIPFHDALARVTCTYTSLEKKESYSGAPYTPGVSISAIVSYGLF